MPHYIQLHYYLITLCLVVTQLLGSKVYIKIFLQISTFFVTSHELLHCFMCINKIIDLWAYSFFYLKTVSKGSGKRAVKALAEWFKTSLEMTFCFCVYGPNREPTELIFYIQYFRYLIAIWYEILSFGTGLSSPK